MSSSDYESLLREFAKAFDENDLDKAMRYFSEDTGTELFRPGQ